MTFVKRFVLHIDMHRTVLFVKINMLHNAANVCKTKNKAVSRGSKVRGIHSYSYTSYNSFNMHTVFLQIFVIMQVIDHGKADYFYGVILKIVYAPSGVFFFISLRSTNMLSVT